MYFLCVTLCSSLLGNREIEKWIIDKIYGYCILYSNNIYQIWLSRGDVVKETKDRRKRTMGQSTFRTKFYMSFGSYTVTRDDNKRRIWSNTKDIIKWTLRQNESEPWWLENPYPTRLRDKNYIRQMVYYSLKTPEFRISRVRCRLCHVSLLRSKIRLHHHKHRLTMYINICVILIQNNKWKHRSSK